MELLQMFVPLVLVTMVFAQYADPSSNRYDNAENYGDNNNNGYVNYHRQSAGHDNQEYPVGGKYESINTKTTSDVSETSSYTSQPPYLSAPSGPSSYTSQPPYASQSPYYSSPPQQPSPSSYPTYPSYPKPSSSEDPAYSNNRSIPPAYSSNSNYASNSDNNQDDMYPCTGLKDGTKFAVQDVCYAYFKCSYGHVRYQECDAYNRFDANSGNCVPDENCVSACPDGWKAHPTDNSMFMLAGQAISCPKGTSFDNKTCTCQRKSNETPANYPASN